LCDKPIKKNISLIRGFATTHPTCSYSKSFELKKIKYFFEQKTLIYFDDDEIEELWFILMQGL
jgi:hypothetical protein